MKNLNNELKKMADTGYTIGTLWASVVMIVLGAYMGYIIETSNNINHFWYIIGYPLAVVIVVFYTKVAYACIKDLIK